MIRKLNVVGAHAGGNLHGSGVHGEWRPVPRNCSRQSASASDVVSEVCPTALRWFLLLASLETVHGRLVISVFVRL